MTDPIERRGFGQLPRILGWGAAAALLATPLIAMQFTDEVDWTAMDFVAAAVLIGALGAGLEIAVRLSDNLAYRIAALIGLGTGFVTIWSNLAVGIIGSEDNPANMFFFALIGLAILGSALARFRAGGMALVMLCAGAAQIALGGLHYGQDPRGATMGMVLAIGWLLSAALFQTAQRRAR